MNAIGSEVCVGHWWGLRTILIFGKLSEASKVFSNTDWWTYIAESGKCVANVPHRVVGEGDEGVVGGEGVPPGGKGGFSQPVPEESHPLPLSPKHTETGTKEWKTSLSLSRETFDSNMWQSVRFCTSHCHQINSSTCFFPLRTEHKTLNINAFFASGHIQNSNNL